MTTDAPRRIRWTVLEIESLSIGIPLLFLAATCAIPLVHLGVPDPPVAKLLFGAVAFAAARVGIALSTIISIYPLRRMRYRSVAQALADQLRTRPDSAGVLHKWTEATPGALGMTRSGKLVLIDRSTHYCPLDLDPARVLVAFEPESLVARFFRWSIGDGRLGDAVAVNPFVSRQIFLAIRYRGEGFGPLFITRIAFGNNRREAEMLYANLSQLSRPGGR